TSNAALTVSAGDQIKSGENTTLAADPGTAFPTATGIAHGYELYFIPATGGSSTTNSPTSSTVTVNGSVTAGVYHELDITVTNNSPDYLVLGSINIPSEPGGQVIYTGQATAPPTSMHVIQSGPDARPVVRIQELYDQPVPASNTNGPAVFLTAALDSHGS